MNESTTNGTPAISGSLARVLGVKPDAIPLEGIQLSVSIEAKCLDGSPVFHPVTSSMKLSSPDNPDMREGNLNQVSAFLNGQVRSFMAQLAAELPAPAQVVEPTDKILTMPRSSRDDLA